MNDRLLLLVRLDSPSQAVETRAALEAAGVRVALEDGDSIEVRVPADDLERARAILKEMDARSTAIRIGAPSKGPNPRAEDEEEEETKPGTRERLAEKAFKATVFGLVFPLLLPFGVYLLVKAMSAPGKLEGRYRRYAWWAGLIYLLPPVLIVALLVIGYLSHDPDADMGRLPRPEMLVGAWQAEATNTKGEKIQAVLDLNEDGQMRYRIVGPGAVDFEGLWGYDDHGLYVRYRKRNQGNERHIGKTDFWPMVAANERQFQLDQGRGPVLFRRK